MPKYQDDWGGEIKPLPRWWRWVIGVTLASALVFFGCVARAATCSSGQDPFSASAYNVTRSGATAVAACAAWASAFSAGSGIGNGTSELVGTSCYAQNQGTGYFAPITQVCEPDGGGEEEPPGEPGSGTTITCGAACAITIAIKPEEPASAVQAQRIGDMSDMWLLFLGATLVIVLLRKVANLFESSPHES